MNSKLKPVTVKGIQKGLEAEGWHVAAEALKKHLERYTERWNGQVTNTYMEHYNAKVTEGATFVIKLLKV